MENTKVENIENNQMNKSDNIKKRKVNQTSLYFRSMLDKKVCLPIKSVGKNLKQTLEKYLQSNYEGKCHIEGYIKPNTIQIKSYSSGIINRGNMVIFNVMFECLVCYPVENMLITCKVKNITKAGIRGESDIDVPSPVVVFVAKDHHYKSRLYEEVNINDIIIVRVIGQRFELNDRYISIIGELVNPTYRANVNK